MVSSVVQQQLNALIQNYGRNSLTDPATLESLIKDKIGQDSRDASLLIAGLHAGVPQAIAAGSSDGATLAEKLRDQSFISSGAAESSVRAWAEALGISLVFESRPDLPATALPPLPHVEILVPEHSVTVIATAPQTAFRPPARRRLSFGVVSGLVIAGLAILAAFGGYAMSNKPHATKTSADRIRPPATIPPVNQTTAPVTADGLLLDMPDSRPLPNVAIRTPSAPVAKSPVAAADPMPAYNLRLAAMRRQYDSATDSFSQQVDALSSESDPNTLFDKAASTYEAFSQTLGRFATNLDTATPPAEAEMVHRQIAANMRQLSTLVEDVAQAAKDRDETKFSDNRAKVNDFLQNSGAQLGSLVSAAGYDPDQFGRDGTLVRK